MRRRSRPAKVNGTRPSARRPPKVTDARVRDLEKRLAEALQREAAAFEQRIATAEILEVISRSAFDLPAVLKTVLENATRPCAAESGVIFESDGEGYRAAAVYSGSPEFNEARSNPRLARIDCRQSRARGSHGSDRRCIGGP